MTGLGDILSGVDTDSGQTATPEPAPAPPSTPPAAPAPRTEPEPGRTGGGDAAPPAAPEEPEPQHVPFAALKDERGKRQTAEARIAELERKVQEAQQSRAQQEVPARPDLFENPDGALDHIQRQFQEQLRIERVNWSVAIESGRHDDYAAAETAFIDKVKSSPDGAALYQRMLDDPNPAGFAYREGKKHLALGEIGEDPAAYRERVRQEEREAVRREFEAQHAQQQTENKRRQIPPSLASARDTQGRFVPVDTGPTPLADILAPRR